MNKEQAYLLGAYLTDGTVSANDNGWKQFRLTVKDESFAVAVYNVISVVGHKDPRLYVRSPWGGPNTPCGYDVYCGDQDLCCWLEEQTWYKQVVPASIVEADRIIQLAFLAGVMDGDGYICYGKPSTKAGPNGQWIVGLGACGAWVLQVRYLMQQLGVQCGEVRLESKGRRTPLWRFTVNKGSFVRAGLYFRNERKQQRLEDFVHKVIRSSETKREASCKG